MIISSPRNGLVEIFQLALRMRRWFYALLAFMLVAVTVILFVSDPVYVSSSMIAAKGQKNTGDLFSQLRLGSGGAGDIGKMEVYLTSQDLAERVVRRINLLPDLYPEHWDETKGTWKAGTPSVRKAGRRLLRKHLAVSPDIRKGRIEIDVMFRDSLKSHAINQAVLDVLNDKMQEDIAKETEVNRRYLEKQYATTSDPQLIQKITSLIAAQIESGMLISGTSFEVLAAPSYPFGKDWPKPKILFVVAIFLSVFLFAALVVCAHFYRELRRTMPEIRKVHEG